jgi:hypothetical protein
MQGASSDDSPLIIFRLAAWLVEQLGLKMDAKSTFETFANFQQTTPRNIPENSIPHTHRLSEPAFSTIGLIKICPLIYIYMH